MGTAESTAGGGIQVIVILFGEVFFEAEVVGVIGLLLVTQVVLVFSLLAFLFLSEVVNSVATECPEVILMYVMSETERDI